MSRTPRAFWRWTIGVACAVGVATSAVAGEPAYLAEMPSVEQVRRSVQGASPLDTLAQQAATFDALRQILQLRTERPGALADPSSLTAGEREVVEAYSAASRAIFETPGVDRSELLEAGMRYSATPGFEEQVAARFFSASWLSDYAAARPRFMAAYQKMMAEADPPVGNGEGPSFELPGAELLATAVRGIGAVAIAVLLAKKWFRRRSEA